VARLDQLHPENVAGRWFADTRCIDCDVARHYAPSLIGADEQGLSVVLRQPSSDEDELAMWRAALACPTQSIGTRDHEHAPPGVFPWELVDGVHLCGYNDESSFGAHSYVVVRPEGNLLVDSPRYTRRLVEPIEAAGGLAHVLLSHRDDVADADRWSERFGAEVWIHELDAGAAPYADHVVAGVDPVEVRPGLTLVPAPGHTRGSVVYHLEDRFLFTGDTLAWDFRRERLDVFPGATWYSWDVLAESIATMADLRVEWVLPGHGKWHHVGYDRYAEQMAHLADRMTRVDRRRWYADDD
jgi:glyoxylase-like metal-dependent hydrolase (beta-lactamase superfamily II)/ferredoxin